jgi:hypothetical protein
MLSQEVREMDFFNDLGKRVSSVARSVSEKTRDSVESTRLASDLRVQRSALEQLYTELGRLCYEIRLGRGDADQAERVFDEIQRVQERIEELVRSEGPDKGRVLNEIMTSVMRELARVITPGGPGELPENPEVVSRPAVEYARYLVHLPDMRTCIRLCKCLSHLPIVDSELYRDENGYYLILGLRTLEDGVVFELRRTCMEFASELLVNAPETLHIEETADCVIGKDAAPTLAGL